MQLTEGDYYPYAVNNPLVTPMANIRFSGTFDNEPY